MSSLRFLVFAVSALTCAGCLLDRGGLEPGPRRDGGPRPDGQIAQEDARVASDAEVTSDAGQDAALCTPTGPELCDGVDNDCDPSTADGAEEPTRGEACDDPEDADLCADGAIACSGGVLICAGDDGDQPSEVELCDGLDNDCDPATADGSADPGAGAACDDDDVDLCPEGTQACVSGALACVGDDGDNADEIELCDGADNDCNPDTPDGVAEDWSGDACDDDDLDLCLAGTFACAGGAMVCAGDDGDRPSEVEVCDGVDNDCNPATADGSSETWIGMPCDDPADADLCPEGTLACAGGAMTCVGDDGDQPGEVELCDGADNDCNPLTLDGAAETLGGRCDGPDADGCREGMITGCSGGALLCSDTSGDSVEVCNGRDDDCDLVIDEGTSCPSGCTRVARGGASYLFCVASLTWTSARDACRAVGAAGIAGGGYELVSIGDAAEQSFVAAQATMLSTAAWWIGLNDRGTEGAYTWVADGSALGPYRPWELGQPNDVFVGSDQDCISIEPMDSSAGGDPAGWNDYGCNVETSYVCEARP